MIGANDRLVQRLQELQTNFDQSFAEPPARVRTEFQNLLTIGVGGDSYALRVEDLAGMYAGRAVTPVPSRLRDLIGIAGFRGAIVAVYDLAAALGYPRAGSPRWLVLARGTPLAFAFTTFDGHLSVPREAIAEELGARQGVGEVVRSGDRTLPIINMTSIVTMTKERARTSASKEDG
jgi:chemotaxis signal transduction protein